LGCLDVSPGTRLANIGNMSDLQARPASRSAPIERTLAAWMIAIFGAYSNPFSPKV
jgi:hypothetical protein